MYHALSGFRNNEFKALRENPFVFLKLAFSPNHKFSHAPFSPPTKVLLSTQLLCTVNTPAKRHPPCEDIISLFTFGKVPPYYSTSIWWQNTFLWPFLFSSLLFYNYRHQIHLFLLLVFHLCSCWRWKGLNLKTTKMYSCKWKSTNMNILMLKNSPFHTVQFSLCNARNKTLGLCPERLFLNSLLSDTQRKQHWQD